MSNTPCGDSWTNTPDENDSWLEVPCTIPTGKYWLWGDGLIILWGSGIPMGLP